MKVSADLLKQYERLGLKDWVELEQVWREYEAACDLAEGAAPRRSAHWRERVPELEAELRRRIATCGKSGK